MKNTLLLLFIFMLPLGAQAGNDPSIKGNLRQNIKTSMNDFIQSQTINDKVFLYDAVQGKLLNLKFDNLHEGIVKKNGFYVSCADFIDQNGHKIDVDFLVRPAANKFVTTQALIHAVDGKKRKYHLENM